MGVSIVSLAINNPETMFNIHVFVDSISNIDISRLQTVTKEYYNIKIDLYSVDNKKIFNLPTLANFPLAIYYRMLIPLFLTDIQQLLYLDSDIICLKPIAMNECLTRNIATVVPDVEAVSRKKQIELNIKGKYFNSGVMLINVQEWNKQNISEKVLSLAMNSKTKYSLPDQDVLNILLENKISFLPHTWNYMHGRKDKTDIPTDVIFLHCAAHPKPWKCACSSKVQPIYRSYELLSPWSKMALELPGNYQEARSYAKILFKTGKLIQGLLWFNKYVYMKFQKKILRNEG